KNGEEPVAAEPVRPVLTAISRDMPAPAAASAPADVAMDPHAPAATLPPPPEPPPVPQIGEVGEGEQMQVIKLNALQRMQITDLAKMASDLGIEGATALKKQELTFG